MSTSERVMDFPVTTGSSVPAAGGLFASYELKPEKRPGAVLAGYIILALLLSLVVVIGMMAPPVLLQNKYSSVTLVAPTLSEPPQAPKLSRLIPQPAPAINTPSRTMPEMATPVRITAPRIAHVERPVAMPAPAAPKTALRPNLVAVAPPMPIAKPVHVGSFGDPSGVPVQQTRPTDRGPSLGSFGMLAAAGTGHTTGRGVATGAFGAPTGSTGQSTGRKVATGAFGTPTGEASGTSVRAVKAVAFGEPTLAKVRSAVLPRVSPIAPVALLSKPAPVYTEEARRLHIEGTVTMKVIFAASGEVRIVGVLKGLGHGLDEAAATAARQIRFSPARRDGQPVDYPATIHIVFALS